MFPPEDEWSEPTEETGEPSPATLAVLLERIRQKCGMGLTPVDELRLLVATRHHQSWSPQSSEAELVALGFAPEYSTELVRSTLTSGQFGWAEHSVSGDGFYWKSPTFERKRQLAKRAAELDGEARRLAGQAPFEPPPPVPDFMTDLQSPPANAEPLPSPSALKMRFVPAQCPNCNTPVVAPYSQYRRGRRSIAFRMLFIAGILAVGTLLLVSFWGTFSIAYELTKAGLRRREVGMLSFLAFLATLPLIFFFGRVWWRIIHRFPLMFEYECPTCHWVGACGAKELRADL